MTNISKNSKRVLFISYFFPPMGGGGVQRTVKYCKYLRDFGWDPVVLAPSLGKHSALDESYSKDLPKDLKIYRARFFSVETKRPAKSDKEDANTKNTPSIAKNKVARYVYHGGQKLLCVPDPQMLWRPFALRVALRVAKKEQCKAIYSTSSPFTNHLVARDLARLSGIPWVADFRDHWTLSSSFKPATPLHKFIMRNMEKDVLLNASGVTATNQHFKRDVDTYFSVPIQRYETITNGFDPDDFPKRPYRHKGVITLNYIGSFYGKQYSVKRLLDILENVIKIMRHDKIKFSCIGDIDTYNRELLHASKWYGKKIFYKGYIPHDKAVAAMQGSTFNILQTDYAESADMEHQIPQKLFEYIGSGRPIIAIAHPDGETSKILQEVGNGIVLPHKKNAADNAESMKRFIYEVSRNSWKMSANGAEAQKYHRKELTKKLAHLLNEVSDGTS